jgi:hypothetical protein
MLLARKRIDVLLTHDVPAGVVFPRHREGLDWVSEAVGLDDLVRGTRPRVCFFGHHHTRLDAIPRWIHPRRIPRQGQRGAHSSGWLVA